MTSRDPRIDAYIIKSADFAIPILDYLRETVHAACPNVKETMKWSMPYFEYNNYNLCSMAAFKQHCGFHFWLGSMLTDPDQVLLRDQENSGMGQFGKIARIEDLPSDQHLFDFIREAMTLTDNGVRLTKDPAAKAVRELVVPAYISEALEDNRQALVTFQRFSNAQKREYVDWIAEAKNETTRDKRLEQALMWMQEGKSRNWKYQR
jgi:uncharacterized protein YdeI (YjbR/CyaY-like superfamily)